MDSTERATLDVAAVAAGFGCDAATLASVLPDGRLPHDFAHRAVVGAERDAVILRVLRTLAEGAGAVAGPERLGRWESGWDENLQAVRREGFRPDLLEPRYFRADVARWNGGYVVPEQPRFEHDLFGVLRRLVFATWCADADTVVELGCGTGANLVALAAQCPGVTGIGGDWTTASQGLLAEAARATGHRLRGVRFDMFHPAQAGLRLDRDTVVLTVHALEQLGTRFQPLLDWLVAAGPRRGVHVEPILELYDDAQLLDVLARDYHRRRGYLDGFLPALRRLADVGRIRIVAERRVRLGSLFHEAYSIVVWEPAEDRA